MDTFVCRATGTKDCVLLDGHARSVYRRGVGEVRNPRLQAVAVLNASPQHTHSASYRYRLPLVMYRMHCGLMLL